MGAIHLNSTWYCLIFYNFGGTFILFFILLGLLDLLLFILLNLFVFYLIPRGLGRRWEKVVFFKDFLEKNSDCNTCFHDQNIIR